MEDMNTVLLFLILFIQVAIICALIIISYGIGKIAKKLKVFEKENI